MADSYNKNPPSYWSPPGFEQPFPNYHTPKCNHPKDIFHPHHCHPCPPPITHTCNCSNSNSNDNNSSNNATDNSNPVLNYRIPVLEAFPWQETVKSKKRIIPPENASKGDRYLIYQGHDSWSKYNDNIAWFDGYDWHYDLPLPGWVVYVEDEDVYCRYNGKEWLTIPLPSSSEETDIQQRFSNSIIYVSSNVVGDMDGTVTRPYKTIKMAIDQIAVNNNNSTQPYIINIAPGVYTETVDLDNLNLYNIRLVGSGRTSTFIGNPGFNSLQCTQPVNLNTLSISDITFTTPIKLVGVENSQIGMYLEFYNVGFKCSLFLANLYHPIFTGYCTFDYNIILKNIAQAEFFNNCIINNAENRYSISLITDFSEYYPEYLNTGTTLMLHCNCPRDIAYSLPNENKAFVVLDDCIYGQDDVTYTIPINVTFESINSFIRGSLRVDGNLILSNSFVKGTIIDSGGTIDIKNQRIEQIYGGSEGSGSTGSTGSTGGLPIDPTILTPEIRELFNQIEIRLNQLDQRDTEIARQISYDQTHKMLVVNPEWIHS